MYQGKAYRVIITTEKGLNLIFSNKNPVNERTYSNFVSAEEAEQFAQTLHQIISKADYTDLDRCFLCSQPFTRKDELCVLSNDKLAHLKCFYREARSNRMSYQDKKGVLPSRFPYDMPEFDFSNLDSEGKHFKYAIQTVSQTVIHLYLRTWMDCHKTHACLTYHECVGLIMDIRDKLDLLQCAKLEACLRCGKTVYVDQDRYQMASGELIHGKCMEAFIRSEAAAQVSFPAVRTRKYDIFGFARSYPEFYDLNPFLQEDEPEDSEGG